MPGSDAQRVWFPEMVERLRSRWRDRMSVEALIELRDELDGMLDDTRSRRNIHAPVFTCPICGARGRSAEPHISVRATILALVRFGVASKEQTRTLDRDWAAYRKKNGLDLHGKGPQPEPAPISGCLHPNVT